MANCIDKQSDGGAYDVQTMVLHLRCQRQTLSVYHKRKRRVHVHKKGANIRVIRRSVLASNSDNNFVLRRNVIAETARLKVIHRYVRDYAYGEITVQSVPGGLMQPSSHHTICTIQNSCLAGFLLVFSNANEQRERIHTYAYIYIYMRLLPSATDDSATKNRSTDAAY